jgi:uncharacterized protein
MSKKKVNYYPNFWQSMGIVGIAILLTLLFSPLNIELNDVMGKEISFLVYYSLSFGGTFGIVHWIRKKKTGNRTYDFSLSSFKLMTLVSVSIVAIHLGIMYPIVNSLHIPEFMREIILEFASQKGVFSFVTIVILAPVIEEIIFRGIILDGLLKKIFASKINFHFKHTFWNSTFKSLAVY